MPDMHFDRDGTVLTATRRDGEGPPLLLVPGVMADAATWQAVVDAIDLPNPVITLNRRGRAGSGPLGDRYSVRTEISDLHRVIDDLGGEVELFGWSYGGLIALETAAERGDVRSVVAYEPVSAPFAPHAVPLLREALGRGDLDRAVEIVNLDVSGFSPEYVADLRREPVWAVLRELAGPLARELAAINDFRVDAQRYRALDPVPVTLLLGEVNEGLAPYGTAFSVFADALPKAEVVRLAGEGHLAHATAPGVLGAQVAAAVRG
ncbi:alpha/beta fold hydrolase [Pseudonocardia spinosispora]|uniref:alpha/beta fold hydrolase n=1 Tax=Pseudonocardia spinosispora TaxID=103441 RepID=UPI00041B6FD9|nr:alpha/beta hydrolase [Pseudonocardia spinosispora]